jgi:hypothetical protein
LLIFIDVFWAKGTESNRGRGAENPVRAGHRLKATWLPLRKPDRPERETQRIRRLSLALAAGFFLPFVQSDQFAL